MKTTSFKAAFLCAGLCASVMVAGNALADIVTENYSIGTIVPDNNPSGLAVTEQFSAPGLTSISDVTLTLNISGGANGDYYAYLQHGTGFSVLLNRVGRDTGNPTGYLDSGLNVTLDDSAPNGDIHTYQLTMNPEGATLTGTWATDGRNVDPTSVVIGSPRTALLNSFNGLNPNGGWTLFVSDTDPGGVGTLQSFGITVTGVPEPESVWLLLAGGVAMLIFRRFALGVHRAQSGLARVRIK